MELTALQVAGMQATADRGVSAQDREMHGHTDSTFTGRCRQLEKGSATSRCITCLTGQTAAQGCGVSKADAEGLSSQGGFAYCMR